MTRQCSLKRCNIIKPLADFGKNKRGKNGIDYICKECRIAGTKDYTNRHKKERLQYNREYKQKNKEKVAEYNKSYLAKYYKENREKVIAQTSKNTTKRRQTNIQTRLANNLRRRLHHALKGKAKSKRTLELLGCKLEYLVTWLEKQFSQGMTWENYGSKWQVDHIKALANYDLTNEEELKNSSHYTNLQPLLTLDNIRKSDRQ